MPQRNKEGASAAQADADDIREGIRTSPLLAEARTNREGCQDSRVESNRRIARLTSTTNKWRIDKYRNDAVRSHSGRRYPNCRSWRRESSSTSRSEWA